MANKFILTDSKPSYDITLSMNTINSLARTVKLMTVTFPV